MIRIEPVAAAAAALLLAGCAHDTTASAPRGERASVNSYATTSTANGIVETGPTSPNVVDKTTSPLTGSVTGSIQPSPSAMGTTTTSGSLAGTTSTSGVSDSTRSPAVNDNASSSSLGNGASTTPSTNTQPGGTR
jgi:PBP1b-binding outer membrane lipoprotein LpoB